MKSDIELMQKVRRIAGHIHRFLPAHARVDVEDLVQDGMVGLLDAKRLYDPQKGADISAFADMRISGAIRDGLRALDCCSRAERARIKHVRATTDKLAQELGRAPTNEETAAAANVPLKTLYEAQTMAQAAIAVSLSSPLLDADGECTIADGIADDRSTDAFEVALQNERRKLLRAAFRKLNRQERQAIYLYYLDENEYTLFEIGQVMGLSVPRVSQVCTIARGKLAAELRKHPECAAESNCKFGDSNLRPKAQRRTDNQSALPTSTSLCPPMPGASNWFMSTSIG